MTLLNVSIIVPCYNAGRYLPMTIPSLLAQTLSGVEFIFVNDGSTDGSGEYLDEIALRDRRVRVVHKPNGGLSSARNAGLERATGKYTIFVDADDPVEPRMAETLFHAAEADGAQLTVCGYYMEIHQDNRCVWSKPYRVSSTLRLASKESIRNELLHLMDASLIYNTWNKLYDRELLRKSGLRFAAVPVGEDWDFNLRYLLDCQRVTVIEDCLYHYIRERREALSTGFRKDWFRFKRDELARTRERFIALGICGAKGDEFLDRWYAERILGCVDNEFSADNRASSREKRAHVREMISDATTRAAFSRMKPASKKVWLMSMPIKAGSVTLTCAMGRFTVFVRRGFPSLFYKMKSSR